MTDKEESEMSYLDELINLEVGGNKIPSASGLVITCKLLDSTKRPKDYISDYEGKKSKKFKWEIKLISLTWSKPAYEEVLGTEKPKKLEYIKNFIPAKDVNILELSPTATKQFALFIKEKGITDDLIKYMRTGTGNDTKYQFKKVGDT